MRRYIVTAPCSLQQKILMLPGDELYSEGSRLMMNIFSIKTRKQVGSISAEKFAKHFKIMEDGKK